jgi:hypothetical protein
MITKGKIMSEAYNRISQGLKEAIEYSRKDKVELEKEIKVAEQQIVDGKYTTDDQVEKRLTERYSLTKSIKTEKDYEVAIKRLEKIFDAPVDSKEGDEAELLLMLVENYENQHYPIEDIKIKTTD